MKGTKGKHGLMAFVAALSAVVSGTLLSGCSALSVGEEEFACTGMPGSVFCHSARDVYETTNSGVVPSPVGKKTGSYNSDCDDCVRAEDVNPELVVEEDENSRFAVGAESGTTNIRSQAYSSGGMETVDVIDRSTGERKTIRRRTLEVRDDEVINNYVSPALPDTPVPVRTPAQVMRIWVAPYVDTRGDLQAPGFVYTEIEPRRWIYPGGEEGGHSRIFAPLQASGIYGSSFRGPDEPKNPGYNSLEKLKRDQMRRN